MSKNDNNMLSSEYLKCSICGKREKGIPYMMHAFGATESVDANDTKGYECGQCNSQICTSCVFSNINTIWSSENDRIICPNCNSTITYGMVFMNTKLDESKTNEIKQNQLSLLSEDEQQNKTEKIDNKIYIWSSIMGILGILYLSWGVTILGGLLLLVGIFGITLGVVSSFTSSVVTLLLNGLFNMSFTIMAIALLYRTYSRPFDFKDILDDLLFIPVVIYVFITGWDCLKTYFSIRERYYAIEKERKLAKQRVTKQ